MAGDSPFIYGWAVSHVIPFYGHIYRFLFDIYSLKILAIAHLKASGMPMILTLLGPNIVLFMYTTQKKSKLTLETIPVSQFHKGEKNTVVDILLWD